jgi:hypothetical protein
LQDFTHLKIYENSRAGICERERERERERELFPLQKEEEKDHQFFFLGKITG